MGKVTLLEELCEHLQKMEESAKVDISILNTIDKLIGECHSVEDFWMRELDVSIQESFQFYHASRNARFIFWKMKQRFIEAEAKHDNPAIVHDSLAIIPSLGELCTTLSTLTKQTINKDLVNRVSELVEDLRDLASENSLLPTPEEELKELDEKRLQKRFNEFAETLQAMQV